MSMELIALDRQIIQLGNALAQWQDAYNNLREQYDDLSRQHDVVKADYVEELAGRILLEKALRKELPDHPAFLDHGPGALRVVMQGARQIFSSAPNIEIATANAVVPALPDSEVARLRARVAELEEQVSLLEGERDDLGKDLVGTTAYYTALKEHMSHGDPRNPLLADFTRANLVAQAWQEWERTGSWVAVKDFAMSHVSLLEARQARGGVLIVVPDEENQPDAAQAAPPRTSPQQEELYLKQLVTATACYSALGTHLHALAPTHPMLTEEAWDQLQTMAWQEWLRSKSLEKIQELGASFLAVQDHSSAASGA